MWRSFKIITLFYSTFHNNTQWHKMRCSIYVWCLFETNNNNNIMRVFSLAQAIFYIECGFVVFFIKLKDQNDFFFRLVFGCNKFNVQQAFDGIFIIFFLKFDILMGSMWVRAWNIYLIIFYEFFSPFFLEVQKYLIVI